MKKILFVLLVALLVAIPTTVVLARAPLQVTPPGDFSAFITAVVAAFMVLVNLPGAIAALNNLLMKLVPGFSAASAGVLSFVVNVAFFLLAGYAVFTGKIDILAGLNVSLGGIAQFLANILVILGGFGVSFGLSGHYTKLMASHGANMKLAAQAHGK